MDNASGAAAFSFDLPAGGASPAADQSSVAGATATAARGDADRAVPKRRGRRPRQDDAVGGSDINAASAEVAAALRAQLEQLHDPEAWSALLCLPADAAQTWTGKKHWELAERERKALGVTGSAAARTMMVTNPRALAFTMLASALFSVYVPRAIKELKEMREAEAAKKGEKPA